MKQQIRKELREIREALRRQEDLSASDQGKADRLIEEIDGFLEKSPPTDEREQENMLDGLKQSVEEFEASHPTLGLLIEKFIDTLSNLGI